MINNNLFQAIFDLSKNLESLQESTDFYQGPVYTTLVVKYFSADDLFEYIDQYDCKLKYFLRERDQKTYRLALDTLSTITKESEQEFIGKITDSHPQITWYGASRFNKSEKADKNWSELQDCLYFIPKIEIVTKDNQTTLKLNILNQIISDSRKLSEYFFDLLGAIKTRITKNNHSHNILIQKSEVPNFDTWAKMIQMAHEEFETNNSILQKVILSRREELVFSENIDIYQTARKLYETHFENSHYIYFKYANEQVFLSVTPETLFKTNKEKIFIDSIAGTIKRDNDPNEDMKLAKILSNDPKEIKEHEIVTKNILNAITDLTEDIVVEFEKNILKLKHIQHLHTKITAKLKLPNKVDLLKKLHPTAAIGGEPKDEAMKFIHENEDRPRGLYAAPLGYISKDESLFIVGIRSCLINNNRIDLFGGCGVVRESIAINEWNETKIKMNNFRGILENI